MAGWNADTRAGTAGAGAVTILEGASFSVSASDGDIEVNRPHGMFFHDTRLISAWYLRVNGHSLEALSALVPQPFRAIFIGRAVDGSGVVDSPLLVERQRRMGTTLREDITLQNFSQQPVECTLELALASDFADIFDVKEGKPSPHVDQTRRVESGRLVVDARWKGEDRGFTVNAPGAHIGEDVLSYEFTVPAHGSWTQTVTVLPTIDGKQVPIGFPLDQPLHESPAARRFLAWNSRMPVPSLEDDAFEKVIHQSQKDLGSLRIFNPNNPDRPVVAAGAPWFMALFGRDSILASYMALHVDPSLALGTLQSLGELQGAEVVAATEEQPGRILHEVRLGASSKLALGGGSVYYGTVDATPLYVMLLGELRRWGLAEGDVDALLPHADRALDWIRDYGDRDGDGFVEYQRLNEKGLVNQGWKDSWDGINFADGTLAETPIALCEVQGYVYAAYLSRALIAKEGKRPDEAKHWLAKAAELKGQFNERFWMPRRGYFAIALDGRKRQVDSCASNMGQCLWTGIIDEDKAPLVVERLMSPEMFSGWGVRTLATDMGAYNPASYHNGSVWPHDNALITAGLMRYGFVEEAQRVAFGILEAADYFGGRLPELFCGFDRNHYPEPVAYPTSCSPQAWAAATPLSLIRTLLRFDPCLPTGEVWVAPALPEGFGQLRVDNFPLGSSRVSIDVSGDRTELEGLPSDLTLHRRPRALDADLVGLSR